MPFLRDCKSVRWCKTIQRIDTVEKQLQVRVSETTVINEMFVTLHYIAKSHLVESQLLPTTSSSLNEEM